MVESYKQQSLAYSNMCYLLWSQVEYRIVFSISMDQRTLRLKIWDTYTLENSWIFANCAVERINCIEELMAASYWRFTEISFRYCWFHGSSLKGFSIVCPAPWLANVESSQKLNGMWFFIHFFASYLFHRSRNNRRDKQRSKFWRKNMFRKSHLTLLRWFSVHGTNK